MQSQDESILTVHNRDLGKNTLEQKCQIKIIKINVFKFSKENNLYNQ